MLINGLFNKFIPPSLKDDLLAHSYAINVLSTALIAAIAAPSYAFLYYILGYPTAAYVIFLSGIIIVSSGFCFRRIGSLFWTRQIIVSILFFCLLWLTYGLGGVNSAAAFWFILPPLMAIFLGGIKDSLFWGALSVGAIFMLFTVESLHIPLPVSPISNELVLQTTSICGLILIILGLVYLYEQGKRAASEESIIIAQQLRITKNQAEKLAEKAEIANHLKSEFLANMSHELRTPLNAIIGFTELIYSGKTGDISDEQQEYLGDIASSAHHLLELINDILDLSKIEAGKMVFHPELVNLKNVVLEIRNSLTALLANKHLHLTVEIEPPLEQVIIDPQKLKQVIYNYLSNAIKFTNNGGKIKIHISSLGANQFKLEVEDNGIGIRAENIHDLFTPFRQLDPGTAKRYQGTGLGLALTRRIVETQGGSVGVKSEIGKGSVFFAILPCWPLDHP